jgi:glutamyl-tRNA synthetase
MTVRTRIEPSPSGSIHVGNAYAALFNWLFARKQKGAFILRIADTDRERVTEVGLRSALDDLRWLGLDWDEGPEVGGPFAPYFQSERFDLYGAAVKRLLEEAAAYACYCTNEELAERRERALAEGRPPGYDGRCRDLTDADRAAFEAEGRRPAIRFRMPDGETRLEDLVRGDVVWDHAYINDFVIQRADGTPLYMLAVSYDDMAMELTHVIRAEEHLSNTPKQIALIRAMGGVPPTYAHVPLIVGADRKKLSKRHGATSVGEYRRMGFLPDVVLNYLAILSWSTGDGVTERFTVPELIEAFDISGMTKNPSAFDQAKLEAFNGERIRELTADGFIARALPYLAEAGLDVGPEDPALRAIAPLVQERCKRLDEVPGQVRFLYESVEPDERAAALLTPEHVPALEAALGIIQDVEPWGAARVQEALNAWAEAAGVKKKVAFQPVRAAITGSLVSPPLFESIEILGRDEAVARLRAALERARG